MIKKIISVPLRLVLLVLLVVIMFVEFVFMFVGGISKVFGVITSAVAILLIIIAMFEDSLRNVIPGFALMLAIGFAITFGAEIIFEILSYIKIRLKNITFGEW